MTSLFINLPTGLCQREKPIRQNLAFCPFSGQFRHGKTKRRKVIHILSTGKKQLSHKFLTAIRSREALPQKTRQTFPQYPQDLSPLLLPILLSLYLSMPRAARRIKTERRRSNVGKSKLGEFVKRIRRESGGICSPESPKRTTQAVSHFEK